MFRRWDSPATVQQTAYPRMPDPGSSAATRASEKSRPISSRNIPADQGEGKDTASMAMTPSMSPGPSSLIRNLGSTLTGYQRMSVAPQVNPEPKAARHTMSPSRIRPCSTHSSMAIGIEAAVVLPYRSMFE